VSPGEDVVVCCTDKMQLLRCSLVVADDGRAEDVGLRPVLLPFHFAAVTGVDVCLRKPLVATCSIDSSVRIW
jgi:hypothetical protein